MRLSRTVLRSSLPAYLLTSSAALAIGGFVTWKVVAQASDIHHAETTTPVEPTYATSNPAGNPVIMIPADPIATASRVTTTGAVVSAPVTPATVAATSAPTAPVSVLSLPATPTPQAPSRVAAGVASQNGRAPSVTAVPMSGLTVLPASQVAQSSDGHTKANASDKPAADADLFAPRQ